MAQLFDKEKDRVNAEKWLKQAVAADPKKLKTRLDAVQWMLRTGDLNAAKAQATEALAIDPESHDALFLAGRVARFMKDYPQAQKLLERSYLESPGAGSVANELALTLVEIGEDERKRAFTLAEATYRQQRDAETAATLGWVCYRLGRSGGCTEPCSTPWRRRISSRLMPRISSPRLPTTAIAATVPRACSKRL